MGFFAKIGRFFNIKKGKFAFFEIDLSFFVTLGIAILIEEVPLYIYFVLSVTLHELSHYFVAKKRGYLAKKIHFNFFGASLEGLDDFLLKDEIVISLAGPIFNLCVVVLCYLCFWFYPESFNFLDDLRLANLAIFCFNMLPIFPLDAGRVLLALLNKKYKRSDALRITKIVSAALIALLFFVFLISFFFTYNFSLGFVCVNLAVLSFKDIKGTSYKRGVFVERKMRLISKGLIERNVYVKSGTESFKLFRFIDDYHYINFMFVDENFDVVNSMSEVEFYREKNLF